MKRSLNVLIVCECSGAVREAFRKLGHNAWSCDLKPAEDASEHHLQEDAIDMIETGAPVGIRNYLGKASAVWPAYRNEWDLLIMHPPCTRMALSGALRMYHGGKKANGLDPVKVAEQEAALQFVRDLISAAGDTPYCIENPKSIITTRIRRFDQFVQPYQFGHDASKETWLWLSKLPPLRIPDRETWVKPRWICKVCKRVSADRDAQCWLDQRNSPLCHHCETTPRLLPRWANQTDSGQNRLAPSVRRATDRARTYPGIAAAMAEQWSAHPLKN